MDLLDYGLWRQAFGAAAAGIPGSSIKSMIGHPQGACGAAGLAATVLGMRDGFLPPGKRITAPFDGLVTTRTTDVGALISEAHLRKVTGYIDLAKKEGGTIVTGGRRVDRKGYFVEPTVLTNTRPEMKVVREEIFGPVLVASPFTDLDEIAAVANDSEYGLGAGIWTKDISKAHALAKKLRAGTVWINCYNVFDAALPFGGYKQSGWGREMGHEVLENYTEVKAVTTLL